MIQICENTKRIAHLTGVESTRVDQGESIFFGSDYCNMEPPCHYCNQGMFVVIGNVMQNMKQDLVHNADKNEPFSETSKNDDLFFIQ